MKTTKPTSELLFSLTVFVGLMPLAFSFSQNGVQLVQETPFQYFVWCFQAITLLLLLFIRPGLSNHQLIGLAVLYIFVPLAFTFTEKSVSFLILHNYVSSVLSWAIASILLGQWLFTPKLNENSDL